ncbi:MAG: glycosyltransferase family 4 protein [Tsuneonella sp.]
MTGGSGEPTRVLVLLGCFGRGIEATGPNQTLTGMARSTEGDFDFRVIAEAVPGDRIGAWQTVSGLPQLPIQNGLAGISQLRDAIRETPHDILISNGFFDRTMTIPMLAMRRAGLIPRRPTLLAPHGEFSPGAAELRAGRKRAWAGMVRRLGLLKGVSLLATTDEEAGHIRNRGAFDRPIYVCPNIFPIPPERERPARAESPGLRIVYASRIDEKKNLSYAINVAIDCGLPVDFDIFGPVSDERYWQRCRKQIEGAPEHCRITYRGVLAHEEVGPTLARYDVMFMPTRGENFGYAIADALLVGTPVLISDRTPWRDLARHRAGFDIPLDRTADFRAALHGLADQDMAARTAQHDAARRYAIEQLAVQEAADALRATLRAVGRTG